MSKFHGRPLPPLLNNVWCVQCKEITGIGNVSGKVESGMLALRGVCTRCGGEVARVIENP
jgi:hypothetical protein